MESYIDKKINDVLRTIEQNAATLTAEQIFERYDNDPKVIAQRAFDSVFCFRFDGDSNINNYAFLNNPKVQIDSLTAEQATEVGERIAGVMNEVARTISKTHQRHFDNVMSFIIRSIEFDVEQ